MNARSKTKKEIPIWLYGRDYISFHFCLLIKRAPLKELGDSAAMSLLGAFNSYVDHKVRWVGG